MAHTQNTAQEANWWRGGVLYQVYPRSFQDSNGDGIGDLAGVVQRLPYLAKLGVDAVWLSPFFKSPMKDFGYDISDYCQVDPMFGTLDDFDTLVREAHAHGLKVLIDQVLSHCSDQHPWFVESASSRDNPRADWFVWADAKPDGSPPNNWLSIFGGSAWQWNTRRQQYYMHNFLTSQPDLNFHNPAVQDAALESIRFWLNRGVDGFRLDVINFCFHDAQLRDNPARTEVKYDPAVNNATPYARQIHRFDKSQPDNLQFLKKLRNLLNEFPNIGSVGEIGDDNTLERIAEYTGGGDKLHMAYGFDLLGTRSDARFLHDVIQRFESVVTDGWACWSVSNHDVTRVATRWHKGEHNAAWLRLVATLLLCLRGSPCIYQGDELGLTEVQLRFDQLQDPFGITLWPESQGRDGCRTPMVWDAARPNAGFSFGAKTWLPVAAEHLPLAAVHQVNDENSLFNFYRHILSWRRTRGVLKTGAMTLLAADDHVLAFSRVGDAIDGTTEALLCAFNLTDRPARYALPSDMEISDIDTSHRLPSGSVEKNTLVLPPFGVVVATQILQK